MGRMVSRSARVRASEICIITVYFKDIPSPCPVFGCHILFVDFGNRSGQLYAVGVVEHHELAETEVSGDAPCALRDFFLHTAVADKCIGLVCHSLAEAGHKEALGYRAADGHGMSLTERT